MNHERELKKALSQLVAAQGLAPCPWSKPQEAPEQRTAAANDWMNPGVSDLASNRKWPEDPEHAALPQLAGWAAALLLAANIGLTQGAGWVAPLDKAGAQVLARQDVRQSFEAGLLFLTQPRTPGNEPPAKPQDAPG